jgi:hypothetical protein
MMQTHTPEPWLNNDGEADVHPAFDDHQFGHSVAISEIDYARAVACVNALRGVSDPAAFVEKVRELITLVEDDLPTSFRVAHELAALLPEAVRKERGGP